MILIALYSLTAMITGYKLSGCRPESRLPWSTRSSLKGLAMVTGQGEIFFRGVSLLLEDKWLLTMVTSRLLGWVRPSLEEWSSNSSTEWFMPPATFFKFWLVSHEIIAWNAPKQFLHSLLPCLAGRRVSQC